MSANNTFLAVFLGSKTNPRMTAWNALPEAERLTKQKEGIAAWKAWAEKHQSAIVGMGGPLGKTKKSRNAASKIQAMRWVPTWSFARTRMRLRPNSSRGIRILRFFPGKPSRSCPFSRYRAPERLRPRIELSINYARARASEPGDVGKGLFHRFGRVQELAVAAKTAGDL